MKKYGFSLIEIVIVLSIILLFLALFKNIFTPKDIHIYHGQRCVNELYAFINNFAIAGLSSKGFNSGGVSVYPEAYKTIIDPEQNKIENQISLNNIYSQHSIINLSGVVSPNQICYIDNNHKIELTGNRIYIETKKSTPGFFLGSGFKLSGHIDILLRKKNGGFLHIGQYLMDIRSQTITKRVCLGTIFSGSDCSRWNQ